VDEAFAWLNQALADREAAEREYNSTLKAGSRIWCHALAMYQQTIEKSVKAMVAALRQAGFWRGPPIGFVHEVERHMRWLVRLRSAGDPQSIQRRLVRLFDADTRAAIRAVEALTPQAPQPGERLRRNTEYPFHDAAGEFTYPATPGEFSSQEVDRFRALSHRLAESAGWVVSTLRRRPR
jgi:hypothetical protein